jgi:branched-chain amino acid transport system substrate-binding protein
MRMVTNVLMAVVLVAAPTLLSGGASAAQAPKCGLNNGKAASGQPIQIGAIVGKTGRPTSAVQRKPRQLTSLA